MGDNPPPPPPRTQTLHLVYTVTNIQHQLIVPKRSIFIGSKASSGGSIGSERVEITRTVVTAQDRAILEIFHRESK
ncbi:hypothetical protein E3N88_27113 [Mikania micrantha]|uniref:Uncharacterized protein n=1 Tax=Mikania micrantha TaxID=192012 RepID=A0A5N6MYQ4_9ASTR|nr:hypothetical protein E3N88_27113 [Mikania micrantha]